MEKTDLTTSNKICPYLGLKDDPATSLGYPSSWNLCQHAQPSRTPDLSYQQLTCLTSAYKDCPIFKSSSVMEIPKSIRDKTAERLRRRQRFTKIMMIIGFTALFILGFTFYKEIYAGLSQRLGSMFQQTEPVSSYELPATETPTLLPTERIKPTLTPTTLPATPTPTLTPTKEKPVLALDMPIGRDVKYVIHRVVEGEALGQYAAQYDTNENAIRESTLNLPSVLFIDQIIVIPVDMQDVSGLPAFEAIMVEEERITAEMMAAQLSVQPEEFYLYNNLEAGHILNQGDWILVPRESTQQ